MPGKVAFRETSALRSRHFIFILRKADLRRAIYCQDFDASQLRSSSRRLLCRALQKDMMLHHSAHTDLFYGSRLCQPSRRLPPFRFSDERFTPNSACIDILPRTSGAQLAAGFSQRNRGFCLVAVKWIYFDFTTPASERRRASAVPAHVYRKYLPGLIRARHLYQKRRCENVRSLMSN